MEARFRQVSDSDKDLGWDLSNIAYHQSAYVGATAQALKTTADGGSVRPGSRISVTEKPLLALDAISNDPRLSYTRSVVDWEPRYQKDG